MIFSDSSIFRTKPPNNGVINGDNKHTNKIITITVKTYQKKNVKCRFLCIQVEHR